MSASPFAAAKSEAGDRRRFLGSIAGASLIGFPSPALASLADERDAGLLELGRRWEASNDRMKELTERLYEVESRTTSAPLPEEIYWQRSDGDFWLGFSGDRQMHEGEETGRFWYRWPNSHRFLQRQIDQAPNWQSTEYRRALVARAQQILDAFAAWERDDQANQERTGLTAAYEALRQATEASTEIRRTIVRTPAHTLPGIYLKAAVAFWCHADDLDEFDEEFAAVLAKDSLACGDSPSMSLVRDLVAFAAVQKMEA